MTDKNEDLVLSQKEKEEEQMLDEWFVNLMDVAYPNYERIGCPDPQILRDLAFHRSVSPEILDAVLTHMTECSPCCHDARAYAGEYRKTTEK